VSEAELSQRILPPHIEETIRAIADLHADHHRQATRLQRTVDRLTALVGQPRFIVGLTAAVLFWTGLNVGARALRLPAVDPPPFAWLSLAVSVGALYVTAMILSTQRRENALGQLREQLTLELAILSEQKTAKIIGLLEEMRRDSPHLPDRHDPEAEAMASPADPASVLEAIRDTQAEAESLSDLAQSA
jgi:uncharacterized membrane protein